MSSSQVGAVTNSRALFWRRARPAMSRPSRRSLEQEQQSYKSSRLPPKRETFGNVKVIKRTFTTLGVLNFGVHRQQNKELLIYCLMMFPLKYIEYNVLCIIILLYKLLQWSASSGPPFFLYWRLQREETRVSDGAGLSRTQGLTASGNPLIATCLSVYHLPVPRLGTSFSGAAPCRSECWRESAVVVLLDCSITHVQETKPVWL